jgi:hypothetical protein
MWDYLTFVDIFSFAIYLIFFDLQWRSLIVMGNVWPPGEVEVPPFQRPSTSMLWLLMFCHRAPKETESRNRVRVGDFR